MNRFIGIAVIIRIIQINLKFRSIAGESQSESDVATLLEIAETIASHKGNNDPILGTFEAQMLTNIIDTMTTNSWEGNIIGYAARYKRFYEG